MGVTSIFQYQNMLVTALNGMTGKMIPALQTFSYVLMTICLLLAIFEAFAKGGDTRQLAASVVKYIVVAFVVMNWPAVFGDLVNGFNTVAQYLDLSYGAGDLLQDWQQALSNNWQTNGYGSIWNLISNGGAAVFNAIEIGVAYIIFPLAAQVFTLLYVFWGAVLYAIGPLVLALAPSTTVNSVSKFYAQNLVVWNCWSILYAVFGCLITAVNGKDLLSSPFFSPGMAGGAPQVYIGLTSILYSLCILLIPVIAYAVLKGDFGPVGGKLMGLAMTALMAGRVGGLGSAGGGGGAARGGGGGGGSLQGGTVAARNYSMPPASTPPNTASSASSTRAASASPSFKTIEGKI